MKEIVINKVIENEVEGIIALASQLAQVKKNYPECWRIVSTQYQLKDYNDMNFIPDDVENIKISIYAAIIRQQNINEDKKIKEIKKALVLKK